MTRLLWTLAVFLAIPALAAGFSELRSTAITAVAASLFLIVAIGLAGAVARKSRRVFLFVFTPGLYMTEVACIGLVLVHAYLAISAVIYIQAAVFGWVHTGIPAVLAIGALGSAWAIARHAVRVARPKAEYSCGAVLSRTRAPRLWARVDALSARINTASPDNIVLGIVPECFVTHAPVYCDLQEVRGRTLYCSAPLTRLLTSSEFDAMASRELAHFNGAAHSAAFRSCAELQERATQGTAALSMLPAVAVLGYFLDCFTEAESMLNRGRPVAATDGLAKVQAAATLWGDFEQAAMDLARQDKQFLNASKDLADATKRLLREVVDPAAGLIDNLDEIERSLSAAYYVTLVKRIA